MKRLLPVLLLLAVAALAGCAETPDQAVRKMRLEDRMVFGQKRLFSTVGFWVLDEPVRQKVMACYRSGGLIDRMALRSKLSDAHFAEEGENILVTVGTGTVPEFVLSDGPLIALPPASDEMVHRLAQDYAHDGKPVTVVEKK